MSLQVKNDEILSQIENALRKDEFSLSEVLFFDIFLNHWNCQLKSKLGSPLNVSKLPSKLEVPLLNQLAQSHLNIGFYDFIPLTQTILNSARVNYKDVGGKILPLPQHVKDLNVDADFFNSFLSGNLSFSPSLLKCSVTQSQVLLELKQWNFYSASHLVEEKGFFAYRFNRFGLLDDSFIQKDFSVLDLNKVCKGLKKR